IFAIMLVLLVNPFIRPLGLIGHLLSTLFLSMIPLASAYALTENRKKAIIVLIIAAPFVILDGLNVFFTHRSLMVVAFSFGTILYFYIVILLVINLLSIRVITADLIFCAISIYLLIGIMWAGIYSVLEGISPGSFSEASDLLYFSFVTLTTVGFGDVAPLSVLCKRLAVFEAAMGSIYMAVIIAMIVGRYMSMQVEINSPSKSSSKK
ncbi:MAG: potassium channel family protein, partial [Desulfobacterales bacterium]